MYQLIFNDLILNNSHLYNFKFRCLSYEIIGLPKYIVLKIYVAILK